MNLNACLFNKKLLEKYNKIRDKASNCIKNDLIVNQCTMKQKENLMKVKSIQIIFLTEY